MAKRPEELPEWASGEDASITEPLAAQKESGWVAGDAPAAGVQNWYQENVYRWIEYLQDVSVRQEATALAALHLVYDSGVSDDLNDAAIDPTTGKIVVVGNSGEISKLQFNANGVDENPGLPATTEDFYAVAWDSTHSLFILCGEDDTIQTSPGDGTWTSRSDTGSPLRDVAVSDAGIVVCVGDSGSIKRSADGTTYATQTAPIGALDHKEAVWFQLPGSNMEFFAIGSTGAIVSAPAAGTGWLTFRSAVGAADVVNIGAHENWGLVSRYNNTVRIDTITGSVDHTIAALSDSYTQMLVLPSSIIFSAPFGTATAMLQVYGPALEYTRVFSYHGTNLAITKLLDLDGKIWALTNDQIWSGGAV